VGQKLSDLTTSRVVLLVLAMLFVLPVFNIGSGIYGTAPPLGSAGIQVGCTADLLHNVSRAAESVAAKALDRPWRRHQNSSEACTVPRRRWHPGAPNLSQSCTS